jgi:hypothetical protein
MKHSITITVLAVFYASSVFGQGGMHHERKDEIRKIKIDFITNQLQLTEKEIKEFVPIYNEYNDKLENIYMNKRKKMKYFHQNNLNMSEKELIELGDYIVDSEIKSAELAKVYHNKYKTVLPPMKILLLHKAEQEFKRELFNKIKNHGVSFNPED